MTNSFIRVNYAENRKRIRCIRSGGIRPDAELKIIDEGPAFLRVSANGGLGIPASCETVERLIAKSAAMPLAAASVSHSDHYGAAGYFAMKCAEAGLIGFSMSNTCPLIAVTGAAKASNCRKAPFPNPNGRKSSSALDNPVPPCYVTEAKTVTRQAKQGDGPWRVFIKRMTSGAFIRNN